MNGSEEMRLLKTSPNFLYSGFVEKTDSIGYAILPDGLSRLTKEIPLDS